MSNISNISIILIEPEHAGNVGAICRAMENFGFYDLILVNPKCDYKSDETVCRAKHAKSVLKSIKVKPISCLKQFDILVATTAQVGTDYNISRSPLTPEQLKNKFNSLSVKKKNSIAIVFGREGSGLTNEEIALCDFTVTIPTSIDYPTMNISHSVAILCYELSKLNSKTKVQDHITAIGAKEKQQMEKMLFKILDKIDFSTKEKRQTQKTTWKRIFGKAMLTNREAFVVFGFLGKVIKLQNKKK